MVMKMEEKPNNDFGVPLVEVERASYEFAKLHMEEFKEFLKERNQSWYKATVNSYCRDHFTSMEVVEGLLNDTFAEILSRCDDATRAQVLVVLQSMGVE